MSRLHGDDGSTVLFVAVIAFSLLMLVGMVYDGGTVLTTHAAARKYAAQAARIAAQQIDYGTFRTSQRIELDSAAAREAGADYLQAAGVNGDVAVRGDTATVVVTLKSPMRILPLSDRAITAVESAAATPTDQPQETGP